MRARLLVVTSLLLAGLAGPAWAGKQPPTVPDVAMSQNCPVALVEFRRQSMRFFFAIAEDLSICAYSYCTTKCKKSDARRLTLHRCEKESGVSCLVYDANDRVPEVEGY